MVASCEAWREWEDKPRQAWGRRVNYTHQVATVWYKLLLPLSIENDESLYVLDLSVFVFVLFGKHARGNINLMLLYRNIFFVAKGDIKAFLLL